MGAIVFTGLRGRGTLNIIFYSFLSLILFALLHTAKVDAFTGAGSGTQGAPYVITNCDDLQSIKTDADGPGTNGVYYEIANDIDCSATTTWNAGAGFDPISSFDGYLDGRNYTISGLYINRSGTNNVGLFRNITSNAQVSRINMTGIDITGDITVGALAGGIDGARVTGVTISGAVTGDNTTDPNNGIGGFAGSIEGDAIIGRSSFSGTVDGPSGLNVGGFAGYAVNMSLIDVFADAQVTAAGGSATGGLIGRMDFCCNVIQNAYSAGSVTGDTNVSGIIGYLNQVGQSIFENIFTASTITGSTQVGVFAGQASNSYSNINNGYFDQSLTGVSTCVAVSSGSFIVDCTSINSGGLDPNYFFTITNEPLASWNSTSVWQSNPGDYPTLRQISSLAAPGTLSSVGISFPVNPDTAYIDFGSTIDSGSFPVERYEYQIKYQHTDWTSVFDTPSFDMTGTFAYVQKRIFDLKVNTTFDVRFRAINAIGTGGWYETTITTQSQPSVIVESCSELMALDDTDETYRWGTIILANDIDCSGIPNFASIGNYDDAWGGDPFGGTFDGRGFTIHNLNINTSDSPGLFTYTVNATIRNVRLRGGTMTYTGSGEAGALVGWLQNSNVTNVHSDIDVTADNGTYVGGLIGYATSRDFQNTMTISASSSTGAVSGDDSVGGLIGYADTSDASLTIMRSFATGNVSQPGASTGAYVGGLIGNLENWTFNGDGLLSTVAVEDSYAHGTVDGYSQVGGLIGNILASDTTSTGASLNVIVRRSYASGSVSGNTDAGGLIGSLSAASGGEYITLSNNFAAGTVTNTGGLNTGSFVGAYNLGTNAVASSNNYFDSSNVYSCSDLNALSNCSGVDESVQTSYFSLISNAPLSSWDFTNIWLDALSYPVLVQDVDGDNIADDQELSAPNSGDANNDGILDAYQPEVTSFFSSVTGKQVVLESDPACVIFQVSSQDESGHAAQDTTNDYDNGFINFTLHCLTAGASATVTQFYYDVTGDFKAIKYNSNTLTYSEIGDATITSVLIGTQNVTKVTYSVTDGGNRDTDGVVNSAIIDPVGIVLAASTTDGGSGNLPGDSNLADTGSKQLLHNIILGLGIAVLTGCLFRVSNRTASKTTST